MKYADLVQFAPIDAVVELRAADSADEARRLVETFVVSERMAELLCEVVVPQLQFARPADNRGLLVVGNYGAGKSHLLAVISAVAERRELAARLTNPRVADRIAQISGVFEIVRVEIGSTRMGLRDILCRALADGLAGLGVRYGFPAEERHENKTALLAMMAAFQAVHAESGLVLVVDELLDYLRSRGEQELGLDLSFLRELGEVCRGTRFRVIAGVQESLFDNPRFAGEADALRRVKDRFESVRIARDDVAFVVAERLLKKDTRQRALVREHLLKFCPLYGEMSERLDEYVRLFPVHPAYLTMVERVAVAERRDVLKILSAEIRRISGEEVPADSPGLIAYDAFLGVLRDNPVFRAVPEIQAVLGRSEVLAARIKQSFTRPQYRPLALRIVDALAVHRLTVDMHAPVGVTAEQLRDDLCLLLPLPERDAGFLRTVVEAILKEIVRTVRGQFISFNSESGQYFIDIDKDIDFEAVIERRAGELAGGQLDLYYFEALRGVLLADLDAAPCVRGHRCWAYEAVWRERGAGREGILCLGVPSERPTSLTPREFCWYFVQPFAAPEFVDACRADEVFFRLAGGDEFVQALRRFAGARELAATASGGHKKIYEDRASEHLRTVMAWLHDNLGAVEVSHQGLRRSLLDVVGELPPDATIRELLIAAGERVLASHFQDRRPDYPVFGIVITRVNRGQAVEEALWEISGGPKGKLGAAVLGALGLAGGRARESRYAREVLELLDRKGPGQVLNRGELVQSPGGVESWVRFGVEPEFLLVVLAALVRGGDIVLSVAGEHVDAVGVSRLVRPGVARSCEFDHVERPKGVPLAALQELCELLGVPRGLVVDPATRADAVAQIQRRAGELLGEVVTAQARMGELVLWGRSVLAAKVQHDWRTRLEGLKGFLESLRAFDAVDRLKDFPHDAAAVKGQEPALGLLREALGLALWVRQHAPLAAYLGRAEVLLGASHPWQEQAGAARAGLLAGPGDPERRAALVAVQAAYQDVYIKMHARARLGDDLAARRAALVVDPRLTRLWRLASIEGILSRRLREFEERLAGLRACSWLARAELEVDAMCPHCGFRPAEEPVDAARVLGELEAGLDEMAAMFCGAFDGVRTIVVRGDGLRSALAGGGPCTLAELRARFEGYLVEVTAGCEPAKVRVVIE